MDTFNHFLLTKFNIRIPDWGKFKNSIAFGSDDWMEHRFKLFERYCFHSIVGQTNQNFRWLILMDSSTTEVHRGTIADYQRRYNNIEPLFTTIDALRADVHGVISKDLNSSHVITTRIDNDDAYRRDAIEAIQRHFQPADLQFLNFTNGYKYSTDNARLHPHRDMSSPFMSLIERRSDAIKNVQFEAHHQVQGKWPLRQIGGGRYWLQVIHERNVLNALQDPSRGRLQQTMQTIANIPALFAGRFMRQKILRGFGVATQ